MDKDGIDVILFAKPLELGNIILDERLNCPPTGIAAEHLHGRTAKFMGALHGKGKTA
jgi:hypothetical protein